MRYCIMSIKPMFYQKILSGEKQVEYRKRAPKNVDIIYLYVSSPIKKILAYIILEKIVIDKPEQIWQQTEKVGGISKDYFLKYVGEKTEVAAIYIKEIVVMPKEIRLLKFYPPQNYLFRTDEEFSNLD